MLFFCCFFVVFVDFVVFVVSVVSVVVVVVDMLSTQPKLASYPTEYALGTVVNKQGITKQDLVLRSDELPLVLEPVLLSLRLQLQ